MSVRKVVTRRGGHSRGLTPSIKNPIAAAWESQWERAFAQFLELSPLVLLFVVQPIREPIIVNGSPASYIPDLEVKFVDGSIAYFEVKPAVKCRNVIVAARLDAIRRRFHDTGRRFYLVTDEWLSQEPRRSNVSLLMYHRRDFLLNNQERIHLTKLVSAAKPRTVRELINVVGSCNAWLLLGLSIVGVDLEQPLSDESEIFLEGGHRHANFYN